MKPASPAALLLAFTTALHADTFGTGPNTFTIDFVTVGDPGNANDTGTTGAYSSLLGGVAGLAIEAATDSGSGRFASAVTDART